MCINKHDPINAFNTFTAKIHISLLDGSLVHAIQHEQHINIDAKYAIPFNTPNSTSDGCSVEMELYEYQEFELTL